jgi:hypothetical protein
LFSLLPKIKTDEVIAAFASAATVTRLHLRYTKDSAPDDLVFKTAEPIHGGIPEAKVAGPAKANRFQGRYVMWVQGCGSSGGIGGMFSPPPTLSGPSATSTKLIDPFEQIVVKDVPELDVKAVPLDKDAKPLPYTGPPPRSSAPPLPPRATVKVLDVQVNGSLDKEIVKRIVLRNRGQVQFCFERELLRNSAAVARAFGGLAEELSEGEGNALGRIVRAERVLENWEERLPAARAALAQLREAWV